jgi:hypothetical protein
MPVRIKTKLRLAGSVTPSALNTETDIVNLDVQSNDYIVEGYITLRNMSSNDAVIIREYIVVDGTNSDKSDELSISGTPSVPVVRVPAMTLPYNAKFRVTVTQTAGSTVKSFPYVFIVQILEEI